MKKHLLLFSLILAGIFSVSAQNFEGKITYEIEYNDLPDEIAPYESMLPKENTVILKGTKSRLDMNQMGAEISMIADSEKEEAVQLMNIMGKKVAIKHSTQNEEEKEEFTPEVKQTNETKVIAGFKCKKAIVIITNEDGESVETEVFYTNDIQKPAKANLKVVGVDGFLMQFTVNQNGLSMTMTVTEVSKEKIDEAVFEIPSDYEEMTMEEFQKEMGAMGGF